MILDFDDACWDMGLEEIWKRALKNLLVELLASPWHALVADVELAVPWCYHYNPLDVDVLRARLAASQPRSGGISLVISPGGAQEVVGEAPWRLAPAAALALVKRPLQVYLENDDNDRRFLRRVLPMLAQWEQDRWIEFQHGGGSDMTKKIGDVAADPTRRWRSFFIFDSDRLHPDELDPAWPGTRSPDQCQGHNFERACALLPRGQWHRLERRSIENYLPKSVLPLEKEKLTEQLYSPEVGSMAWFFNMKGGLGLDGVHPAKPAQAIRAARSKGFWTSLDKDALEVLQHGYGADVARRFDHVPPSHPWPAEVLVEFDALSDRLLNAI